MAQQRQVCHASCPECLEGTSGSQQETWLQGHMCAKLLLNLAGTVLNVVGEQCPASPGSHTALSGAGLVTDV